MFKTIVIAVVLEEHATIQQAEEIVNELEKKEIVKTAFVDYMQMEKKC